MKNIAIFASGSGTNAENLIKIFNKGEQFRVVIVLTDRECGALDRAANLGVATATFGRSVWKENPAEILSVLREYEVEIIALCGFLTFVSAEILQAYPGHIVNIHPSLLPSYGGPGMWGHHIHEAVLAAGDTRSGATVHFVTEEVDGGHIIMQQEVDVLPGDTPDSLAMRVHEEEYLLYPRAITKIFGALPPTPEREWADRLKLDYDEERAKAIVPPPVPHEASQPGVSVPPIPVAEVDMIKGAPTYFSAPPQSAQRRHDTTQQSEPMPPTYMLWSILATLLCCFIPGIIAIFFSASVSSRYYARDYEGARKASHRAEICIILSFVLGVISATVWMPLSMLF